MAYSNISDEFVGTKGKWIIPGEGRESLSFSGIFLGFSSSHSSTHDRRAHPGSLKKFPIPIQRYGRLLRCSACRWSEFRLFREDKSDWPYLIHYTGLSNVPREETRYRIEYELTPREVIEVLTTRKAGSAFLSVPAARLLAQASDIDNGTLKEAYNARLVP